MLADDPDEATLTTSVDERMQSLRAQGASEAEILEARARYLGVEAATLIAEREAQDQAGEQRGED